MMTRAQRKRQMENEQELNSVLGNTQSESLNPNEIFFENSTVDSTGSKEEFDTGGSEEEFDPGGRFI